MAQILSFSGGKDSTAMLHKMLEKGEQIDEILFFDTSWEWPQMYEHLALVEEKTGRKITRLRPEKPFDYFAFERLPERTKRIYKGYGWPSIKGRWCTRLKQETMDRYIKTITTPPTWCSAWVSRSERNDGSGDGWRITDSGFR